MDSLILETILLFWISYLSLQCGMPLPNFVFIPNALFHALETSTTRLGIVLRKFQSTTCAEFVTQDLPSEEAARGRQKAAKAKKRPNSPKGRKTGKQKSSGPQFRSFNLSSYKPHALPDYANTIRMFGTTDSYSTQTVSSIEHILSDLITNCNPGRAGTSTL